MQQPTPTPAKPKISPKTTESKVEEVKKETTNDMSKKQYLPLVLSHMMEPNFHPDGKYKFNVPQSMINPKYQAVSQDIESRFADDDSLEVITVKEAKLPDLSYPKRLKKSENFNIFSLEHKKLANFLIKIFIDCKNIDELLSISLYARDQLNRSLFAYAYSVAILHRKDTTDVAIPGVFETMPHKFFPKSSLIRARKEAYMAPPDQRKPVEIPFINTASDLDMEHRCAYFREDMGINSHHWHWHLAYPTSGPSMEVVAKNRRGELFYYMHQQVLSRYNMARFCEGLKRVKRYDVLTNPVTCGYYPKMTDLNASRTQPVRQSDVYLKNINRSFDAPELKLTDCSRWINRIMDGIHRRFLYDWNQNVVPIDNENGSNILGDLIESTDLSINRMYYGDLHNTGHVFFCFCHDPDGKFNEAAGLMSDTTTAMRDIVFYQWHCFINEIFEENKATLMPYTPEQLVFPDIKMDKLELICNKKYVDELNTFWMKSDINLARGLDFAAPGNVFVRLTHLNYEAFSYKITLTNTGSERWATCRIFLLPVNSEANDPLFFEGMRHLNIEMDKFKVKLKTGVNKIIRNSVDSSVTIPFERTFPPANPNQAQLSSLLPHGVGSLPPIPAGQTLSPPPPPQNLAICECGWPQHMLLPKGTTDGYPCTIFAMVSDYEIDRTNVDDSTSKDCREAYSFCGIRDKNYPDSRPMGFPFDRFANFNVTTLDSFLTPNMITKACSIKHSDIVKENPKNFKPKVVTPVK